MEPKVSKDDLYNAIATCLQNITAKKLNFINTQFNDQVLVMINGTSTMRKLYCLHYLLDNEDN